MFLNEPVLKMNIDFVYQYVFKAWLLCTFLHRLPTFTISIEKKICRKSTSVLRLNSIFFYMHVTRNFSGLNHEFHLTQRYKGF